MRKALAAIAFIVLLLVIYLFMEPYWVEIKTYDFSGGSSVKTTIVFVSDIHHGPFFSIERVGRLVSRINHVQPDIVLLGGDYVHRDSKYIEPAFLELEKIKSRHLVAAVLGNHDHWESRGLTVSNILKSNFYYLDNRATNITVHGKRIFIAGVGDLWEDRQNIASISKSREKSDYTILVTHNPDYVENIDDRTLDKIDLILAGHTHGGQVSLFGWWSPIVPSRYGQKYRSGLKQRNRTKILISNGIGTITPPVRMFTRPQIIVVNI